MDVRERLIDRLSGLIKRSLPDVPRPSTVPDPDRRVEPPSENLAKAKEIDARIAGDRSVPIRDLEKASLGGICDLARRHDIKMEVVWPPAPKAVAEALATDGVYSRLDSQIADIFRQGGCHADFFNLNSVREYANFHLDAMHVLGEGWEERVASDYRAYLSQLPPRQKPASASL
jgi:hypothetical protein